MEDEEIEDRGEAAFRINHEIARVRSWLGAPTLQRLADLIEIGHGTLSELARGERPPKHSPRLSMIARIARQLLLDPATLFNADSDPFAVAHKDLRWRNHGELVGTREYEIRIAAEGVVTGREPEAIAERILRVRRSVDGDEASEPSDDEILWMARAGLALDALRLSASSRGLELADDRLQVALAAALEAVAPNGIRPRVYVVPNLAHPDFGRDPAALFLVARLAHRVVADFLAMHRAFTIGIAGGATLAAFVSSINCASSPFPNQAGARRYTLVPLTSELMFDHRFHFADALVGELCWRMSALLGAHHVAPSFKSFGHRDGHHVRDLKHGISAVHALYESLDVAIFGCGDPEEDGWISRMLDVVGVHLREQPVTDVAMNMLDEHGLPIALPGEPGRAFLGVGLRDIQRLAKRRGKMALLLTSGANKGLPLTVVARAGCANTIICDEAAARAALAVLGRERDKPRAA
jgi:DNA-binding transcriptional regulator LsrR (DeoR family)